MNVITRTHATPEEIYESELEQCLRRRFPLDSAMAYAERAKQLHERFLAKGLGAFSDDGESSGKGKVRDRETDPRCRMKVHKVPANHVELRETAKAMACLVVGLSTDEFDFRRGDNSPDGGTARVLAMTALSMAFGCPIAAIIFGTYTTRVTSAVAKFPRKHAEMVPEAERIAERLRSLASTELVDMTGHRQKRDLTGPRE